MDVLTRLLSLEPTPMADLAAWRSRFECFATEVADPFACAVLGGAVSDRLGYAFASGFTAAMSSVLPGPRWVAMAASEDRGAHPRRIKTSVANQQGRLLLRGAKTWCTLGTVADDLLVMVRDGDDEAGRPRIRALRIEADRPGVVRTALPHSPVVPEIPHASLRFEDVVVSKDDWLPGDGYIRYLKPFRTIEDLYVMGALCAHLFTTGRTLSWDETLLESFLASLIAIEGLTKRDVSEPSVHLALAGVLGELEARFEAVDAAMMSAGETGARWKRDRGLVRIAQGARDKRRERAWQAVLQPRHDRT